MKKFGIIMVVAFVASIILVGCQMSSVKTYEDTTPTALAPIEKEPAPVNYMDEIKAEIHDELFREASEETLDIIDRIFKHLEIDTISSSVDGNDASVLMNITTVNAGKAWVVGMERYAIACAENLFAESYDDDATLYSYYLDEFESCVRHADYITMPVVVEMDYHNHRWEWDLDDDVVNAITGQLLAAIEGDLNSSNIVITPDVENMGPSTETNTQPIKPEQNNTSPVSIIGYDVSVDDYGQKCLVVKYKWTNTLNETEAYWNEFNDKAFQNGVSLDTSYPSSKNSYYSLYSNWTREIRPGTSIEFVRFFILNDAEHPENIEVESCAWNGFTDIIYASGVSAF